MAEALIPVDLRNPGQVFACLGFMEAAEVLLGDVQGGFNYVDNEYSARFLLKIGGQHDPVLEVLRFLCTADIQAVAPRGADVSTSKWNVKTLARSDDVFPGHRPDTPAALPALLSGENHSIAIEHWADDSDRDNVKFWAGAGGYPGAALARDALQLIRGDNKLADNKLADNKLADNKLAAAAANPFSVVATQSSSFRFDWRRDYIPLEVGFSPNEHGKIAMVGYPIVEMLAAIGMQNARPARVNSRDKLSYRYGISNAMLPVVLARAVLGGESLGFSTRLFRMRLGWPGQEGQARCIIDAQEETTA